MFYYGAEMEEEEKKEPEDAQEPVAEETTPARESTPRTFTSFDFAGQKPQGKGVQIGIVAVLVLALLLGGWFLFQRSRSQQPQGPTRSPAATVSPAPSPSPIPDKSDIKIQVLNGTGTAGEAAKLKGELEELGYKDIEVGNADRSDYEVAEVTFATGFPETFREELVSTLKKTYTKVSEKTGATGGFDVKIITGLRIGVSPKPSPSPTPKASPTPTPTGSPTPSPSPTPTP